MYQNQKTQSVSTGTPQLSDRMYTPNSLLHSFVQQDRNMPPDYVRRLATSERNIIEDTLLMILGLESKTYRFNSEEGFSINGLVEIAHLTPLSIQNFLSHFTQFSNKIKYIENKLQVLSLRPSIIMSNFVFSIRDYLKELKGRFAQLLSIANYQAGKADRSHIRHFCSNNSQQPVTLLRIKAMVDRQAETMSTVLGLLRRCLTIDYSQQNNHSAAYLFNIFWEIFDKLEHQVISTNKSQLLLKMIVKPLCSYLQFLKQWLAGRELKDPYNQFYIMSTQQSSSFQLENFSERKSKFLMIPTFLKDFSHSVFLSGRFMRTLYCFVKEIDKHRISSDLDVDGRFRILIDSLNITEKEPLNYQGFFNKIKKFSIAHKITPKRVEVPQMSVEVPYQIHQGLTGAFTLPSFEHSKPTEIVKKQQSIKPKQNYRFLSDFVIGFELNLQQTLQDLKTKCQQYFRFMGSPVQEFYIIGDRVNRQLQTIKKFMLMGQGDFIQQTLQNIAEQLDKSVALISSNVLKFGLDNAVKASSARYLNDQVLKTLGWKFIFSDTGYNGWDVFSLDCRVEFPIILVFPQATMDRYTVIFNFLWKLKRAQHITKKMWLDSNRLNSKGKRRLSIEFYAFRTSTQHFISSLLGEILIKIDIQWNKFIEKKTKVQNFYEFLDLHNNFLSKLQEIIFINLSDNSILSKITAILQVIVRFRNLNFTFEADEYEYQIGRQKRMEMSRLRRQFDTLMKEICQFQGYIANEIIDHNKYYEAT